MLIKFMLYILFFRFISYHAPFGASIYTARGEAPSYTPWCIRWTWDCKAEGYYYRVVGIAYDRVSRVKPKGIFFFPIIIEYTGNYKYVSYIYPKGYILDKKQLARNRNPKEA